MWLSFDDWWWWWWWHVVCFILHYTVNWLVPSYKSCACRSNDALKEIKSTWTVTHWYNVRVDTLVTSSSSSCILLNGKEDAAVATLYFTLIARISLLDQFHLNSMTYYASRQSFIALHSISFFVSSFTDIFQSYPGEKGPINSSASLVSWSLVLTSPPITGQL